MSEDDFAGCGWLHRLQGGETEMITKKDIRAALLEPGRSVDQIRKTLLEKGLQRHYLRRHPLPCR